MYCFGILDVHTFFLLKMIYPKIGDDPKSCEVSKKLNKTKSSQVEM